MCRACPTDRSWAPSLSPLQRWSRTRLRLQAQPSRGPHRNTETRAADALRTSGLHACRGVAPSRTRRRLLSRITSSTPFWPAAGSEQSPLSWRNASRRPASAGRSRAAWDVKHGVRCGFPSRPATPGRRPHRGRRQVRGGVPVRHGAPRSPRIWVTALLGEGKSGADARAKRPLSLTATLSTGAVASARL